MERLEQLICKLKEQFEKNVPHLQMLVTVKQIEAELSHAANKPGSIYSTAKVAVVMPSSIKTATFEREVRETRQEETAITEIKQLSSDPKKKEPNGWLFDPLKDIPTLAHQEQAKEINDVIGVNKQSLNDKLKGDTRELASSLKDTPVRDLKKAIGINDRYVFISELFRGDEAMYERSIKTINNFRILPEAEYWMERELKLKLGWDETRESAKHFFQLVRRRFA
ncbi:MAG TPA: hypothetical protein VNV85_17825 [Puia sp.]|jgi:hypothetical protein|nr:hypothetical protein [Puia sp.]